MSVTHLKRKSVKLCLMVAGRYRLPELHLGTLYGLSEVVKESPVKEQKGKVGSLTVEEATDDDQNGEKILPMSEYHGGGDE